MGQFFIILFLKYNIYIYIYFQILWYLTINKSPHYLFIYIWFKKTSYNFQLSLSLLCSLFLLYSFYYNFFLFKIVSSVIQPTALKGTLVDTLKDVRPTLFLGVPRVWEKIEEKMRAVGAATTGFKKKIGTWAKKKGLEGSYAIQEGRPVPSGFGIAKKYEIVLFLFCYFGKKRAFPCHKMHIHSFMFNELMMMVIFGWIFCAQFILCVCFNKMSNLFQWNVFWGCFNSSHCNKFLKTNFYKPTLQCCIDCTIVCKTFFALSFLLPIPTHFSFWFITMHYLVQLCRDLLKIKTKERT